MRPLFTFFIVIISVFSCATFTKACGNSTLSLINTVNNGNGTFTINMELCVAGGRTGTTTNSQAGTSSFCFGIYSSSPVVVSSYSPITLLNYIGTESAYSELSGPIIGNSPFSEQENLCYDFTFTSFPYYQCTYSSAICGAIHIDCATFSITMNHIPDSIRALVIEGENNPQNGCGGPELLIDFTPVGLNVSWSNLSAQQLSSRQALISWETISEVNNDYFEVQKRASSSSVWTTISTVDGNGTSNMSKSYSHIDNEFKNELSYYRIEQTDFDGKKSKSSIIALEPKDVPEIVVFPNPSSQFITISNAKNKHVKLISSNGTVVDSFLILNDSETYNLENHFNGLYYLEFENETDVEHIKLVIQLNN